MSFLWGKVDYGSTILFDNLRLQSLENKLSLISCEVIRDVKKPVTSLILLSLRYSTVSLYTISNYSTQRHSTFKYSRVHSPLTSSLLSLSCEEIRVKRSRWLRLINYLWRKVECGSSSLLSLCCEVIRESRSLRLRLIKHLGRKRSVMF